MPLRSHIPYLFSAERSLAPMRSHPRPPPAINIPPNNSGSITARIVEPQQCKTSLSLLTA